MFFDSRAPPTNYIFPLSLHDALPIFRHLYRPTVLGDVLPFVFAGNPVQAEEGNNRTKIINEIVSSEIFGADASRDRKSTRLNSSHLVISYAVFCLKKKTKKAKNQSTK